MKLIEKRCPNCGASIEFNDDARSCKCDYCNRSFEIEREHTNKKSSKNDDYILNELKTPLKILGTYFVGSWILGSFIFGTILFVFAVFFIILLILMTVGRF